MVHLFSRVTRLIVRVAKTGAKITEIDLPDDLQLPLASPLTSDDDPDLLSSTAALFESIIKASSLSTDPLTAEARLLNSDIEAWIESLQLSTLEHERVQVGNRAYAYTMKVSSVHRPVQREGAHPPSDTLAAPSIHVSPRRSAGATRGARSAQALLDIHRAPWDGYRVSFSAFVRPKADPGSLTWPAIIAGCCADIASRQWVLTLLEGYK